MSAKITEETAYKELVASMIHRTRKSSKMIRGFLKDERLDKEQLKKELMILFIYFFDIHAVIEMGDTEHLFSQVLMKFYLEYRAQHDDLDTKDKEEFVGLCNKRNIEYYYSMSDDMVKYFRKLAELLLRNIHSKGYDDYFAILDVVIVLKGYWDFAENIIQAGLGIKRR